MNLNLNYLGSNARQKSDQIYGNHVYMYLMIYMLSWLLYQRNIFQ